MVGFLICNILVLGCNVIVLGLAVKLYSEATKTHIFTNKPPNERKL